MACSAYLLVNTAAHLGSTLTWAGHVQNSLWDQQSIQINLAWQEGGLVAVAPGGGSLVAPGGGWLALRSWLTVGEEGRWQPARPAMCTTPGRWIPHNRMPRKMHGTWWVTYAS